MSNIFIGLKKDLFGCFRIDEIRAKYNETGVKEGEGIEMSTTVLSIYAMHALFRLNTHQRHTPATPYDLDNLVHRSLRWIQYYPNLYRRKEKKKWTWKTKKCVHCQLKTFPWYLIHHRNYHRCILFQKSKIDETH